MTAASGEDRIVFENVSKFHKDVLGVNRVTLSIPPGITSLLGPNGSGKTTLMNLVMGLVQPGRGAIRVLGIAPTEPETLFRRLGYCTQYDSFPKGRVRQFERCLGRGCSVSTACGGIFAPRRRRLKVAAEREAPVVVRPPLSSRRGSTWSSCP